MLLLHISDIHFRYPDCTTGMDPELPYRTSLVHDVRSLTADLGSVDAMLVGGDIAYHGLRVEYEAASTWLRQLATECGCPLERIFVIPGNHDIDWNAIKNSASVRNTQAAIFRADRRARERELATQLEDAETGRALFVPLENYNAFAAEFSCQVYPSRPFWRQEIAIDPQTTLRIHGLTSTILSGLGIPKNQEDKKGELYLSRFQTVLNPEDGVVNLVLCHHPPDWFLDTDEIEDAIQGRASIHMFGHKHRQRINREANYIRFGAGAVNPDPQEQGWEPGYNLMQLSTVEADGTRYLDTQSHLRRWQTNPDRFVAKELAPGSYVFPHRLPLRGVHGPALAAAAPSARIVPAIAGIQVPVVAAEVEIEMSETTTRNLVLRFWKLPSSQRRDIALRLKLIDAEEMKLPEAERYGKALLRASERGLVDVVEKEVQRMEKKP